MLKKAIIPLFLCVFCLSCIPEVKKPYYPYLVQKIKDFKNEHPTWDNNDFVRDSINKYFIDSVNFWFSQQQVLDSLPIEIESVGKYTDKGKPMFAALAYAGDGYRSVWTASDIDLYLLVDADMASFLKDGEQYYVRGNIIKRVRPPKGMSAGIRTYNLGAYRIQVDSIWLAN